MVSSIPPETVVSHLLHAPTIIRQTATMSWILLETPPDGKLLLTWQPPSMGTTFASDGYIWSEPEEALAFTIQGNTLELYLSRVGFVPGEPVAKHCRRRYRLTSTAGGQEFDPNLWLVHYTACGPTQRMLSKNVPQSQRSRQNTTQREALRRSGQLIRKEFMLHDQTNWPTVTLPPQVRQHVLSQQQTPGHPMVAASPNRPPPQSGNYWQQPSMQAGHGPPPAKRPRTMNATPSAMTPGADGAILLEGTEEEDTTLGDDLDYLTTRDMALSRFRRRQEWVAELMSSPFHVNQIKPIDLGVEPVLRAAFGMPVEAGRQLSESASSASETADRLATFQEQVKARLTEYEKQEAASRDETARMIAEFREHCDFWRRAEERVSRAEWKGDVPGRGTLRSADIGEASDGSSSRPRENVMDVVRDVQKISGQRVYIIPEVDLRAGQNFDKSHPGFGAFQARYGGHRRNWPPIARNELRKSAASLSAKLDPIEASIRQHAEECPTTSGTHAVGAYEKAMEMAGSDRKDHAHQQTTLKISKTNTDEVVVTSTTGAGMPTVSETGIAASTQAENDATMTDPVNVTIAETSNQPATTGSTADTEAPGWVMVDGADDMQLEPTVPGHEVNSNMNDQGTPTAASSSAPTTTALASNTLQESTVLVTSSVSVHQTITGVDTSDISMSLDPGGTLGMEDSAFGDALHGTDHQDSEL
ncbi:MAG: hypothetical protein M1823_001972 [Watsoniomyces obsoletus]|nr:MAG: hypothetical protein M1823_001972 [Watsoniomyces obsoletus]